MRGENESWELRRRGEIGKGRKDGKVRVKGGKEEEKVKGRKEGERE